jgi:competence protein ComEC
MRVRRLRSVAADTPACGHAAEYQPLVLIVSALAAGIVADRWMPLSAAAWWISSAVLLVLWAVLRGHARHGAASWAIVAAVGCCGGAWHHVRWHLYAPDEIGIALAEEPQPVCVEGIALCSPRWVPAPPETSLRPIPKGDDSELLVRLTAVRDGRDWSSASGIARLEVDGHLMGVAAGDHIRVMAMASRPAPPANPGEFDAAAHERSRRVLCRLRGQFLEGVTTVARAGAWHPGRWLGGARGAGNRLLRHSIAPRRATLAAAILVGAREQLDPERNEGYLVTGTVHVLSISGLHVGILAGGILLLARSGLFPRKATLAAAMILTWLYALLTDAQPPVVRAAILVSAVCTAQFLARHVTGYNALALAAIAVLAYDPLSLFLVGTQLSFLAVAAMCHFQPILLPQPTTDPLLRLIERTRPWPVQAARWAARGVWRAWLTGAVVWLASLPLVWLHYGLVSPAALLLNVLISLPIAVALYAGFAALVLGLVLPPLALPAAWVCDGSLWLMEASIEAARGVGGSYCWAIPPPAWWVAIFYVALAAWAAFPALRPGKLWAAAALAVWLLGAVVYPQLPRWTSRGDERPLVCTFVSVGHGTAVILELPGGQTILYDCGRRGAPVLTARQISAALWSRGISHVDAVIVSHADSDHFNALPELLERVSVGVVYVSPMMYEFPPPAVQEFRRAIDKSGVKTGVLQAGDRLAVSGATRIEVLHPTRRGVYGSDNANSIVLLIDHRGRRLLLPGDLEPPGLEDVMAEQPIDCDVVMAPHHGSSRSDPAGFALWSRPEHVVISGSRDLDQRTSVELVVESYRARGAEVYHTADCGAVTVALSASSVSVRTHRPAREPR